MNAAEFREALKTTPPMDIVSSYITCPDPGPNVTQASIEFASELIREKFNLSKSSGLSLIIVGSAKLGFSFTESRTPKFKPRYRSYDPENSDIDMAVVSPELYEKLWSSISQYGSLKQFPWRNSGDLGIHMLHGWIRPDEFPKNPPSACREWKDVYNKLCTSQHFRHKKLRCAIYHSMGFLEGYQVRGVMDAKNNLGVSSI